MTPFRGKNTIQVKLGAVCRCKRSSPDKEPLDAIKDSQGAVILRVRVQTRASRNALCIEPDGRIRVALTAPPLEGAANKALVAFMAKRLGVSKGAVKLVRGQKGREKTLAVRGTTGAAVRAKLEGR